MIFGIIIKLLLSSGAILSVAISAFLYYLSPIEKPFPNPTGQYSVGTTSYHWIDERREDSPFAGSRARPTGP